MFGFVRSNLWMTMGIVGLALGGLVVVPMVNHYLRLSADAAETQALRGKVRTLELDLKVAAKVVDDWAQRYSELRAYNKELEVIRDEAREETRRLTQLFREHNLGDIGAARPGLLERRLNDGTADANRLLECASGGDCTPR